MHSICCFQLLFSTIEVSTQAGRRQIFWRQRQNFDSQLSTWRPNGEHKQTALSVPGVESRFWCHVICVETLMVVAPSPRRRGFCPAPWPLPLVCLTEVFDGRMRIGRSVWTWTTGSFSKHPAPMETQTQTSLLACCEIVEVAFPGCGLFAKSRRYFDTGRTTRLVCTCILFSKQRNSVAQEGVLRTPGKIYLPLRKIGWKPLFGRRPHHVPCRSASCVISLVCFRQDRSQGVNQQETAINRRSIRNVWTRMRVTSPALTSFWVESCPQRFRSVWWVHGDTRRGARSVGEGRGILMILDCSCPQGLLWRMNKLLYEYGWRQAQWKRNALFGKYTYVFLYTCFDGMTWRDVTWRDLTWRDLTWCHVTWRDVTWYDVRWRDVTWDMTWCDVTSLDVMWREMWPRDRTQHVTQGGDVTQLRDALTWRQQARQGKSLYHVLYLQDCLTDWFSHCTSCYTSWNYR